MVKQVQGITTAATAAGLSAVARVQQGADILSRLIIPSGGTLFIAGVSTITDMTFKVPATGLEVFGPAQFYLLSAGATATANIITYLGQGYTGSAIPSP